jgi:hypothetical protein
MAADDDYTPLFRDRSTVYVPETHPTITSDAPDPIAFLDADEAAWVTDAKGKPWTGGS